MKKTLFDKLEDEAMHVAGSYVKEKVTNKILRIGEISLSFLLSAIFLSIAVVELTAHFLPILQGGWNYLIFGVLFLIIGLILK